MSSIRTIAPDDALWIFDVISRSQTASVYPIGPVWTSEQVREECAKGGWIHLDSAGRPAAFILVNSSGVALEIAFLATEPDARGRGVMRSLIDHLKAQLAPKQPLWLEVHEGNLAARRLYERSGFVEVGRRPRYYGDGGAAILYNYEPH